MSEPPLILAADDDEDVLALVEFRLKRAGYEVLLARDGEEAYATCVERRPTLAILDVMMPKLDGFELTRRLRATAETREMPIILLTARVQEADVARGFEAGADDYLRKPFSPEELSLRILAALARR